MKRYKIIKYVDAEPMFQSNAEKIIGEIDNLTFGNDGYLVDDPDDGVSWVPKSVFEKNAVPAHSHQEMLNLFSIEILEHIDELKKFVKHCGLIKTDRDKWYTAIKRAEQYVNDIDKCFNCLRK